MRSLRARAVLLAIVVAALGALSLGFPAGSAGGPPGKLVRLEGLDAGGYAFPSAIVDPRSGQTFVVAELAGDEVLVRLGADLSGGTPRPLALPWEGTDVCGVGRRSLELHDGALWVASHGWTDTHGQFYALHRCPLSPAGSRCKLIALEKQRLEELVSISHCNHRLEGPPLFREAATAALWVPYPVHGGRVFSMARCVAGDCSLQITPMGEEPVSFGRAPDGRPLGVLLDGAAGSERLTIYRCDPATKTCAKKAVGGVGYLLPPVGEVSRNPRLAGAGWRSVPYLAEGTKIEAVLMAMEWSSGEDWALALLRCSLTACTVDLIREGAAPSDPTPVQILADPAAGLFIVGRSAALHDDLVVTRCMPDGTACRRLKSPAGPASAEIHAALDVARRRVVVTHTDARVGALLVRTFPY